jgi:hypothetical protein
MEGFLQRRKMRPKAARDIFSNRASGLRDRGCFFANFVIFASPVTLTVL